MDTREKIIVGISSALIVGLVLFIFPGARPKVPTTEPKVVTTVLVSPAVKTVPIATPAVVPAKVVPKSKPTVVKKDIKVHKHHLRKGCR